MTQAFDGHEQDDARKDAMLFGEQRFEIAAMLDDVARDYASAQAAAVNSKEGSADKYIGVMVAGSAVGVGGFALSKAFDNEFVPHIFQQGAEGAFIFGTSALALSGLAWAGRTIRDRIFHRSEQ